MLVVCSLKRRSRSPVRRVDCAASAADGTDGSAPVSQSQRMLRHRSGRQTRLLAGGCVANGNTSTMYWVHQLCIASETLAMSHTREEGHTQQLARQAVQAIQHAARRRLQMHPLWVAGELSLLLQKQPQLLVRARSGSDTIVLCNLGKARKLDTLASTWLCPMTGCVDIRRSQTSSAAQREATNSESGTWYRLQC